MDELIKLKHKLNNMQSWLDIYKSSMKAAIDIEAHFRNNDYWEITLHPGDDRENERHLLWLLFNSHQSGFSPGNPQEDHQNFGERRFIYRKNPVSNGFLTRLENLINQTTLEIDNIEREIEIIIKKEKTEKIKSYRIVKNFYKLLIVLIALLTLLFTYLMWKDK